MLIFDGATRRPTYSPALSVGEVLAIDKSHFDRKWGTVGPYAKFEVRPLSPGEGIKGVSVTCCDSSSVVNAHFVVLLKEAHIDMPNSENGSAVSKF